MPAIDPNRVQAVFLLAADAPDAKARDAILDRECGSDVELRRQVIELLGAHDQSGSFLDRPIVQPVPSGETLLPEPRAASAGKAAPTTNDLGVSPGAVIAGRFRLLELIGEGGMGAVWRSEQREPVKRLVALKLIKPGMDSQQVLSRFEAERQALAVMDHPSIAKVFDGGMTDQGRPYFVMEYVKGIPITTYCDKARLSLKDRLAIFMQVCEAVQHAHQKGIIHRDLKPSNILVCLYDGKPVPKVIDFGLAKAMHQSLTEHTLYTAHGLMVGTPLYMSPEQAEFNNLDIDTRTDVYSLGVILYELLTGTTPLEKVQFKDAVLQEVLRLIKEEEPQKPSTKLSGSGSLPSIAAQRSLEPAQLSRAVRGDLDLIVMKSLEKERSRRYETASSLARDIDRYLHDEPVEACPPSAAYLVKKFVRRNWAAFATAAVVTIVLVTGTVVSTWQAIRATRAERLADARLDAEVAARAAEAQQRRVAEVQRREAEKQREEAEANFQKARQAVDEYFTLVSESTLFDVPGLQSLRKDLLEAALHFYKESSNQRSNDPDVQANLAVTYLRVAEIYHATDHNDDAVAILGQALDTIDRLRNEHPTATAAHRRLAGFWKGQRRVTAGTVMPRNTDQALQMLQRLAATWEQFAAENPSVPEFQNDLAAIEAHMGDLLNSAGKSDAAAPYLLKAQTVWEKLVRENPTALQYKTDLAMVCNSLALGHAAAGREEKADMFFRRNLEMLEQLVAESPKSPQYRGELAGSLMQNGARLTKSRSQDAETAFRRAVALDFALVEEFPAATLHYENLADHVCMLTEILASTDRAEEALSLLRKTLALIDQHVADAIRTPRCRLQMAKLHGVFSATLRQTGRAAEAVEAFAESCDLYRKLDGEFPNEPNYRKSLAANFISLAEAALSQSNYAEAEATLREGMQYFNELAAAHPAAADYRRLRALFQARLARLQTLTDHDDAANQAIQEAIDSHQQIIKEFPGYGELGLVQLNLAILLTAANQSQQAEAAYVKGVELLGNNAGELNNFAWRFATAPEVRFHQPRWAVELAQKATELAPESKMNVNTLGVAQYRFGQWQKALVTLKRNVKDTNGGDSFDFFFLAVTQWQLENKDEARRWYGKGVEWMDKHASKNEQLNRFRSEAAQLLDVNEKK